ncbi:MAG TPA: SCO2322 family protein [Pedococcus sp.]|jgi:hypothetical protein
MSRTTLRPALAALSLIAALVAAVVVPAQSASAAAYRYWGYFQLQGSSWAFASKGPEQVTPADGSVEGWRFAVAGESDSRMPRATATFADLCGTTPAETGKKRVGVVIDYGREADTEDGTQPPAPAGRCAVVASAATGAEVLASVAAVRAENGLVCAVDQHPAKGCGGEVKEVSAQAQAADTPVTLSTPKAVSEGDAETSPTAEGDGAPVLAYAGIAVAVAAVAGLVLAARRRRADH